MLSRPHPEAALASRCAGQWRIHRIHPLPARPGQVRARAPRCPAASLTWSDAGSLGFQDAGLWTCDDGPDGGLAARSFITRRHHSDPGYAKCWSLVTGT